MELSDDMNPEMTLCQLFFNEQQEQFKIVCLGFNSDWYLIDMNKNEVVSKVISNKTNIQYFSIIRNINYTKSDEPHSLMRSYFSIDVADHAITDAD